MNQGKKNPGEWQHTQNEQDTGLHLVSAARPLKKPADYEVKELDRARRWILHEVMDDAERKRSRDAGIDEWRTGRVLFIDGPRGAGKTSFLLTMLQHWQIGAPNSADLAADWQKQIPGFNVLFPILDFDPLPPSMPLHAWLLEPWRFFIKNKLPRSQGCDSEDLQEQLADLAERAILGFTSVRPEDAGAVAKALAYRDQASGLLDTQKKWRRFVDTVVCRRHGCKDEQCEGNHRQLFVIAIDDVDLQVEKIPSLLHAVRLLWHPNVLYILTGNMDHMEFLIELDYAAQHKHLGAVCCTQLGATTNDKIGGHASHLKEALIEKAIPSHATIFLRHLRAQEILEYSIEQSPGAPTSGTSNHRTLKERLGEKWSDVLTQTRELELCSARRLEYVVDRFARHPGKGSSPDAIMSHLCKIGTQRSSSAGLLPRGTLQTQLAEPIQELAGDRLELVITNKPQVAFLPRGEVNRLTLSEANKALLMQLAVERKIIGEEFGFYWQPVAGFIATQVDWDSQEKDVDGGAVFHWPWLVRPQATQLVLEGDKRVAEVSATVIDPSLRRLGEDTPLRWIEINIKWWFEQHPKTRGQSSPPSTPRSLLKEPEKDRHMRLDRWKESIVRRMRLIRQVSDVEKEEVDRWLVELSVMTAPYVGLPNHPDNRIAHLIREMLLRVNSDLREKLRREQWESRVVKDAIIAAQSRKRNRKDPGDAAFTSAAKSFLEQRKERRPEDDWWTWLKEGSEGGRKAQTAETPQKRPSK